MEGQGRVSGASKETERAELHKTIWRIANDLRGSVDGWDFKTYVLGMLFYRFISENLTAYLDDAEQPGRHSRLQLRGLPDEAGRARPGRDGQGEGLLHPPVRPVRQRARAGPPRPGPQRDPVPGLHAHRGVGRRRRLRRRLQGPVRRPRRQLAASSAPRSPSATRSWSSCSTPSATSSSATPTTPSTRSATPTSTSWRCTPQAPASRAGSTTRRRKSPSCSRASPSSARPRSTRSTTRPAGRVRCC